MDCGYKTPTCMRSGFVRQAEGEASNMTQWRGEFIHCGRWTHTLSWHYGWSHTNMENEKRLTSLVCFRDLTPPCYTQLTPQHNHDEPMWV